MDIVDASYNKSFQSTPPVWGATLRERVAGVRESDFNPRPPCGGRPNVKYAATHQFGISIHAPRVGGDVCLFQRGERLLDISIHAPRVGGDRCTGT